MRKFVTAFACAFALVATQADSASAQTIGFKIGPTWSNMDADPDGGAENGTLSSFGGGGFIRFGFAGLALQLEALAVTKGSSMEDPDSDDDIELKLEYIEVPLTALFSLGNGPYLFVGPTVAFETGCELEVDLGGNETSFDCDEGNSVARKSTDFGVTGGVGIQFPVGPGSILIEGRYTHGLSNINDEGSDKLRNRSYAAFAGYAIPIGRR